MRPWGLTCGPDVAHQLRRRQPRPGDTWHLDAVFRTINGARHDLWRAVAQDGTGRDSLGQPRRPKKAATQCCRTLLNGCHDVPRVRVTAQLKRDGAAKRADHAPQPTRQRDGRLQRCTSPGHALRCLSVSGPIAHYCRPRRHLFPAPAYRQAMGHRCHPWQEITSLPTAA
jgi:putative transposase